MKVHRTSNHEYVADNSNTSSSDEISLACESDLKLHRVCENEARWKKDANEKIVQNVYLDDPIPCTLSNDIRGPAARLQAAPACF